MTTEFIKDPSDRVDYLVDFEDWLGVDTIASVSWTIPTGITNYYSSNDDTSATIWLTEGTVGTNYLITCQITTAGGRIKQQTFTILCREQ